MASESEIVNWGLEQRDKPFLIVVCDTFDFSDYPVHCTEAELADKIAHYEKASMQRIEGVYRKRIGEGILERCHLDGKAITSR